MTSPQIPRTHRWSDLTTADFSALDAERVIAVLPVGATEQHGPHLPVSVDSNLADAMTAEAARHLPADLPALFLPTQRVGFSPEHGAFAGTLSLRSTTIIRLWTDIAESVHASGVRKFVFFNTHGGNSGLMDPVGRDLRMRLGMLVFSVSWYHLPLTAPDGSDVLARFSTDEKRFGIHGGEQETAMMLALHPDLVRREQLEDFHSTDAERARDFPILGNGDAARFAWATQDLNAKGAAGNAAAAKAEDGRALIGAAGRALAQLLQEIDDLPADTLRERD